MAARGLSCSKRAVFRTRGQACGSLHRLGLILTTEPPPKPGSVFKIRVGEHYGNWDPCVLMRCKMLDLYPILNAQIPENYRMSWH